MEAVKKVIKVLFILIILALIAYSTWFLWNKNINKSSLNTNQTSVIQEMRGLQRLETASFTIEKIIDSGSAGSNIFQNILFGNRILLIAHGQVIAGFDFSQFSEKDLYIKGDGIHLTLPKPQILVTTLDNAQTKVYDRQKGILNTSTEDLESEARAQAEKSIKQAACDGGILVQASDNGRKQITALLTALGFKQITIDIPQGDCNN